MIVQEVQYPDEQTPIDRVHGEEEVCALQPRAEECVYAPVQGVRGADVPWKEKKNVWATIPLIYNTNKISFK